MARPLRLEVAGGLYHVTARGNERKAIYRDEADRRRFLELLAATLVRFRWNCLAYCLMTNHYHLLVRTLEPTLACGMRDLNGVYAQAFNRRYGRVGHLFQGRYRAVLVEEDAQLLAVVAYIVRNPVQAGICEQVGDWRHSSHRATLGAEPPDLLAVDELLGPSPIDASRPGITAASSSSASMPPRTCTETGRWWDPMTSFRRTCGVSSRVQTFPQASFAPCLRRSKGSWSTETSRRSRARTSRDTQCPRSPDTSA